MREQVTESVLVAKVARLTNDGSHIGPGSYNTVEAFKASSPSPRMVDRWANNKSMRPEIFVKKSTIEEVGPGAYTLDKKN